MKKILLLLLFYCGFIDGFAAARSVVVYFHNNTPYRLYRVNFGTSHGICTNEPTFSIPPNSTIRWETESNGVLTGTEGTASYTIINQSQVVKGLVNVHWNNPFFGSNSYNISTPTGFSSNQTGGSGNNSTIHFYLNSNGTTPNFEQVNNNLPHIPITSLRLKTKQISSTGNPTFFNIGCKSWDLGKLSSSPSSFQEHILTVDNNMMVDDILWLKLEKKGNSILGVKNDVYGGADVNSNGLSSINLEIKLKEVELIINDNIVINYLLDENEENNILTSSNSRPFWWKIVQPNKVFEPEDLFVNSIYKTPSFDEVSDSDKWIGAFTTFFFKNKGISGWLEMSPELQHISAVGRVLSNPPLSSDGFCTIDIEIEKIKVGNKYYSPAQIGTRYLRTEFKVTNSASATTIATASSLDSWRNFLQNMKVIPQQNNRVEISGLIKWDTDGGGHYEIHPKNFELDPVVIIPNMTTGYKSAGLAIIEGGTGNGLNAKYFNNPDLSGSFSEKIEGPINIYWPNDYFPAPSNISVRWDGFVEAPVSGTYSFKTITDDGVKLWIDGDKIIDDFGYYGAKLNTGARTKYLQANQKVPIKMEWRQGGWVSAARLIWSRSGPNGFADQMIPSTNLYTDLIGPVICDRPALNITANQQSGGYRLTVNNCSGIVSWENGPIGSTWSVNPSSTTTYKAFCTISPTCISEGTATVSITGGNTQCYYLDVAGWYINGGANPKRLSIGNGVNPKVENASSANRQIWKFEDVGGYFKISAENGKYLSINNVGIGSEITLSDYFGDYQLWQKAYTNAGGTDANRFNIKGGVQNGTYTAMGSAYGWGAGDPGNSSTDIKLASSGDTDTFGWNKWILTPATCPNTTPTCNIPDLNISAAKQPDGYNLTVSNCPGVVNWENGPTGNLWNVDPASTTTYKAFCTTSPVCTKAGTVTVTINSSSQCYFIDVAGWYINGGTNPKRLSIGNGINPKVEDASNANRKRWKFEDIGGYYRISGENGKFLSFNNSGVDNEITLGDYYGENQLWQSAYVNAGGSSATRLNTKGGVVNGSNTAMGSVYGWGAGNPGSSSTDIKIVSNADAEGFGWNKWILTPTTCPAVGPQPPLPTSVCGNCGGFFDGANCGNFFGWVRSNDNPNAIQTVTIYSDGVEVASGLANKYREDLHNAGIGDKAFEIPVPASIKNNTNHVIVAKVGNYELNTNYKVINCGTEMNLRKSTPTTTLTPDDVTLSPNPNNGVFKVSVTSTTEKEVQLIITNKSGKILSTRKVKLTEGVNTFDFKISEMEGLYLLNVIDGNVRFNKQVAKIEEE